jgi:predicted transcriptional regulator of viral defense system
MKGMSFERFREQVQVEVFDYALLASYFKNLKKVSDKVASLVLDGKIIRLKKGLYVFGKEWRRRPLDLEVIANLLYGPSCISFEYALTSYGLLAERSTVITSIAIGKSKTIKTPIGTFEYRAVSPDVFKVGIEYRSLRKKEGYFIASKEKALADLVYKTPHIRSIRQLRFFLFEEMRVDEEMFRKFDFKKLEEIAESYNKLSVTMIKSL